MRRPLLFALAFVVAACAGNPDEPSGTGTLAIEGVTVIPMDRERVLADQTVLVRDGRIAAIGSSTTTSAPAGATRVSGEGRFLIPTLAEMHAHVPTVSDGTSTADAERVLFMYVANGIGTIRSMLGDPSHLVLRERARRGEIIAPIMYLAGPAFDGESASTADAASSRVGEQEQAGYDLLKILPGVPRPAFDALAAAAGRSRIPFAGHVPGDVGLKRALEARYATIDHLDGYVEALSRQAMPSELFGANLVDHADQSRIPELVAQTKEAGTWNVPTQILLENWLGSDDMATLQRRPEMRYAERSAVAQWVKDREQHLSAYPREQRERFLALRRRLIKALHDGGARLLLGSDAPQTWNVPGFSIHRELATYVAAGLTPYEALATGTRNIAIHANTLDDSGTIEAGKRADMVLLEANPLDDIASTSRIAGVVIGGRWLPRQEIDQRLESGR